MNTNKRIIIISILFISVMIFIASHNRLYKDTTVKLNSNIIVVPSRDYEAEVKEINEDDIIAKVKISNDIVQANKSISESVEVIETIQGNIDSDKIDIYRNQNFYKDNDDSEYLSIYLSNVLLPDKEYYVILEKLQKKFFYMDNNSYRLKDDLSIISYDLDHLLLSEDKKYTLGDLDKFIYLFNNKEQVDNYLLRKKQIQLLLSK